MIMRLGSVFVVCNAQNGQVPGLSVRPNLSRKCSNLQFVSSV